MSIIKDLSGGDDYQLLILAQKESKELKERIFELYILYTLSKNLNLSLQVDELFDKTIKLLKESLNIEDICFMLMDDEIGELKMWKTSGFSYEMVKDLTFKVGEGISGIVAQTGEPFLIQDVSKEKRFLYYKGRIPDIGSFLSIPLKLNNGKVMGVLNVHKKEINAFAEVDKIFFSAIAYNVANALERTRLYEEAQKVSMFDDLTSLYTRRYLFESFHREFSKATRYGEVFSLIMIDIDNFKYFNDTYGHPLGDDVLKRLAFILKSNLRESDIAARYGGEEFTILLPLTDKDGATLTAEKLRTTVENDLLIEVGGGELEHVTITAGVASYPEDGNTIEKVIQMADKFLYIGKMNGRNKVINSAPEGKTSDKHEKRFEMRHKTGLKIVVGPDYIQSIEIKTNDREWKACFLKDISRGGLKGEVEFEVKVGDVYDSKVVMDSESVICNIFSLKIVYAKRIHQNRYMIGAQVVKDIDSWKKSLTLMAH